WDLEMWFHLLEQGDFVFLDQPLCAFRQHEAQQTHANRRAGIGQHEIGTLLETYYAKPWVRDMATQRMLVNYARFLKKNLAVLGPQSEQSLAQIKSRIHLLSYPLFWLERKATHPIKKMKRAADARALQQRVRA
ncbi:MAG TPA: hypothetical protein VF988_02120, partial [Verrucomicrobiae bacterium]